MKKVIYFITLSLALVITNVYAAPPYLSVDAGSHLSFDTQSCLNAADRVLKKDGFEKTTRTDSSVFAAYREGNPYQYKALVRCMAESGTLIVVVVADTLKHIKSKAQQLRTSIQQRLGGKAAKAVQDSDVVEESKEVVEEEEVDKETKFAAAAGGQLYILTTEKESLLTVSRCLKKAKSALKKAKFIDIIATKNKVTGKKEGQDGSITCIADKKTVSFSVTGEKEELLKSLLSAMQNGF